MGINQQSSSPTDEMIVVGLVHPKGSGGFSIRTPTWTLDFTFSAWRDSNGVLHRTDLLVKGDVTHDQLNSLMEQIHGLSIVKVRIRNLDHAIAEFVELIDAKVEADHELNQLAVELSEPLTYEHSRFGTFTFDRRLKWWRATLEWSGHRIRFNIPGDENAAPQAELFQTAVELWDNQPLWNQRISDFAVRELLPLKNDSWLDNDEQPLSPDEFNARMSLETICVYNEGRFEFWHHDGNLFFGHSIYVSGDIKNGPDDANIAG